MINKGKEERSYLENMLTKDWKCKTGNCKRTAITKEVFNEKKVLFCCSINLVIRKRL